MYQFRAGNQLYCLLTILSVVGEVSYHSVKLLGNERTHKKLIMKLTESQTIRHHDMQGIYRIRKRKGQNTSHL